MVRLVGSLVLAMIGPHAEVPPPAVDPLARPLTPHSLRGAREGQCPDGSAMEIQVHEFAEKPHVRIAYLREGRLVGIFDPEGQQVYVVALKTSYPLADDRVPQSPCDLPDPGIKT
jgi:hypothetical protein